ncbi:MAG: endonuclease III, partial [Muribaculaceae bacterium]|nr:endonuclease III [Muribaculaceae bacterium]
MRKGELYRRVTEWFEQTMPDPKTELHYRSPYELLVAVILSAQCTDVRVNLITPALFEAYPEPSIMAAAPVEEIREYIKSVTYPNNKSKLLKGMAVMLTEEYGGEVPSSIDELTKLPGVGRKTANVVASVIFAQAAMAVDTHVFRVSER